MGGPMPPGPWLPETRRVHKAGAMNSTTITVRWHRFPTFDREAARLANRRMTPYEVTAPCGFVVEAHGLMESPEAPSRGPLGGKVAICRTCARVDA